MLTSILLQCSDMWYHNYLLLHNADFIMAFVDQMSDVVKWTLVNLYVNLI